MHYNLGLSALPLELQEQINSNLHPSAAVALRQTNHYYQSIVSLDRCDIDKVRAFLQEREEQPHNAQNFACYFCLCLKPRSLCMKSPLVSTGQVYPSGSHMSIVNHPYNRMWRYLQCCVECAVKKDRILPGNVVDLATEDNKMLLCIACLTLQCHFCERCRWCSKCAERRTAKIYRKDEMGYRIVPLFNRCWEHIWHHNYKSRPITLVKSDRLLRFQNQAVRDFDTTNGGAAGIEWFDEIVGIEDDLDERTCGLRPS